MQHICNIYAPNKGDPNFFHEVNKILGDTEGEIVLAGHFNEIMDPVLDKSSFRPHDQGERSLTYVE